MKKKRLIISSVLALILVIAGATLALFTAKSNSKTNEFVPGALTSLIWENDKPAPDDTNLLVPADKAVSKEVQVQNISGSHEVDAYIRVMLVPVFRNAADSLAGDVILRPDGSTITVTAPDGGKVKLNLKAGWEEDWIYDNGYFYYKSIVHPDEKTEVLLENITVSDSELWYTFNLEVLSDSIQAESGAAAEEWGTIAGQLEHCN